MYKKLNTWFWYFYEYIKHGDFVSVYASVNYLVFKRSHNKERIIQTSVGKFFCRENTNDFQFANLRYEWGVKRFILDHIHQYSVFIDGGSCIGIYPVLLSKYNVRSIAFEPVASNYEVLVKNLKLNNLNNSIKAYQVGFGAENKLVRFQFNPVNTGASRLDKENKPDGCQVELRTFDSFLTELNLDQKEHILFKLDVEGMETEALQGAANFIHQYPNITFILEEKFSGMTNIKSVLNELGTFEYGMVDQYNMFARKI
jgi:FkbM family methyltransferase